MGNVISTVCCSFQGPNIVSELENCYERPSLSTDSRKRSDDSMFSKKLTSSDFIKIRLLGKGSFSKVVLVLKTDDNQLFAMKILKKEFLNNQKHVLHTKTERTILGTLSHPFLVKLEYAFQTSEKLYFVFEFMQGGELFFHLRKARLFTKNQVQLYAAEILLALKYLHENNIIYRDLKLENIVVGLDGHIKLCDFGLSKQIACSDDRAYTLCGTKEYMAPELLKGQGYNKEVDWWSFGVLIFILLTGCMPFKRGSRTKMEQMLENRILNYPLFLDESSVDLIEKLLVISPQERLGSSNVEEIMKHSFFEGIDFEKVLRKEIDPVLKPIARGERDLSNFDKVFTREEVSTCSCGDELSETYAEKYEGFTYVADSIFDQ